MSKKCNIARDLMPLVIDQAASEESKAYVDEHLESCPDCRIFFEGMQKQFQTGNAKMQQAEEKRMMEAAALALKRKRRRRSLKAILASAALALVLTFIGSLILPFLIMTPAVPLAADQIQFSLWQLDNGEIYFRETALNAGHYIEWKEKLETVEGKKVLSLQALEPRLCFYREEKGSSLSGLLSRLEQRDYDAIRIGREGDWETVWEKGDEVPAASEALNNYWTVSQKISALYDEAPGTPDGKVIFTEEQRLENEQLHAELSHWARLLREEGIFD